MAFPVLFRQEDLELAAGGSQALLQLLDKNKTGTLASATCQAYLAAIQEAALAELYSVLQVAFDPRDTTVQESPFVRQYGVTLGLYWTWHKSTGGVTVPDDVRDAHAGAIAAIKEARAGGRTVATPEDPASNAGAKTVTLDRSGRRILRTNMRGFC